MLADCVKQRLPTPFIGSVLSPEIWGFRIAVNLPVCLPACLTQVDVSEIGVWDRGPRMMTAQVQMRTLPTFLAGRGDFTDRVTIVGS